MATTATLLEDKVLPGGVLWHLQAGGVVLGSQLLVSVSPHRSTALAALLLRRFLGVKSIFLFLGLKVGMKSCLVISGHN